MAEAAYERMGVGYGEVRKPDPRIAARIDAALGDARTVVNLGAGTGSYEPDDREVVAVEPSARMITQRPSDAAPVVEAGAEQLPFEDDSFDAAMAVLTIHHWSDVAAGLGEAVRVARQRVVILTIDAVALQDLWITRDYFPAIIELDAAQMPPIERLREILPRTTVTAVPVPRDCVDGFGISHWARPEAILDPEIRRASSAWHMIPTAASDRGIRRLEEDLESGRWEQRYGHLRDRPELDVGLRLVVSELEPGPKRAA